MKKIIISVEEISLTAELNESATAKEVWDALPFEGEVNLWGEEIYFEVMVDMNEEPDARADVEVGEIAYWPVGSAFCIFFGPTPVSTGTAPRAASPVNVFGRITGDATALRTIKEGSTVKVKREE